MATLNITQLPRLKHNPFSYKPSSFNSQKPEYVYLCFSCCSHSRMMSQNLIMIREHELSNVYTHYIAYSERNRVNSTLLEPIPCSITLLTVQVPVVSLQTSTRTALNCIQWSTNGRELHIGDCDGKVFLFELKEVRMLVYI